MHIIITILALVGASVSAFPTLLSSPVSVFLFNNASCYDNTPPVVVPLEANKCFAFNGAQGLKVNKHDEDLKYNALRVYNGSECGGGWTLQPLREECSDVKAYGSVKVVIGE